jgi:hypothetical protein
MLLKIVGSFEVEFMRSSVYVRAGTFERFWQMTFAKKV